MSCLQPHVCTTGFWNRVLEKTFFPTESECAIYMYMYLQGKRMTEDHDIKSNVSVVNIFKDTVLAMLYY